MKMQSFTLKKYFLFFTTCPTKKRETSVSLGILAFPNKSFPKIFRSSRIIFWLYLFWTDFQQQILNSTSMENKENVSIFQYFFCFLDFYLKMFFMRVLNERIWGKFGYYLMFSDIVVASNDL